MIHKTYQWKTRDKKTLHAQCWKPEEDSTKTILLIHGLGGHSGRYAHWAAMFVDKGFNFLSFDLRGHGKSSGIRGHAKSVEVLLDDIDLAINKSQRLFKENRLILYGHSMGGNLVLNHIIRRNYPVDALIVTSPWLKLVKEPSPVILMLTSVLNRLMPFVAFPNGLEHDHMSHDPEMVRKYTNDPLNHNKITSRLFHEIHHAGYHALRNVYKINYPFLLMHGKEDKVTSHRTSENYVMNTCARTHLKLWEGQYHELHNELIREEVFTYIINWLKEYDLA